MRRTDVFVHQFATYLDTLQLQTWCGGIGSHWAERRTRISMLWRNDSLSANGFNVCRSTRTQSVAASMMDWALLGSLPSI
ncbi:MAG: hypothetical protein EBY04_00690, partial [Actinobacteria bacterium]|nr:hypothetical protein [Actinomycetota bacterium]